MDEPRLLADAIITLSCTIVNVSIDPYLPKRSILIPKVCWIFIQKNILLSSSRDPDQTPRYAASALGLYRFASVPQKMTLRLYMCIRPFYKPHACLSLYEWVVMTIFLGAQYCIAECVMIN